MSSLDDVVSEVAAQAVSQAMAPLLERIEQLEQQIGRPDLEDRLPLREAAKHPAVSVSETVLRAAVAAGELPSSVEPWCGKSGTRTTVLISDLIDWDKRRRATLDAQRSYGRRSA
jgi:hypothetical protein